MLKKTCKEVKSIIKYINTKKALQNGNLPITVGKENIDLFSSGLSEMFNLYTDKIVFPNGL